MLGRERIGIVLNEENAWATARELEELGPLLVRSIVFDINRFKRRVDELPANVGVIALLNSETLLDSGERIGLETNRGWETRWDRAIDLCVQQFARPRRRLYVECLNEWDLLKLPAEIAVKAVHIAAPKLRAAGIGCLLGSVTSGDWPAQLREAIRLLTPEDRTLLDGVCFHPYLKSVVAAEGFVPAHWNTKGTLSEAVQQAYDFANPEAGDPSSTAKNLPVWLTEFGLNRLDIVGDSEVKAKLQSVYLKQAYHDFGQFSEQQLSAACWFSWNDRTGIIREIGDRQVREQFGLWPEDDSLPAWATRAAYIECTFPPAALAAVRDGANGAAATNSIAEGDLEAALEVAAETEVVAQPEVTDPEVAVALDAVAAQIAEEPEAVAEPEVVEPEAVAEPELVEPEAVAEPEVVEPEAVAEPEVVEPEVAVESEVAAEAEAVAQAEVVGPEVVVESEEVAGEAELNPERPQPEPAPANS